MLELQNEIDLKGFRKGKVPPLVIKNQFGKAVYGEVIDQVLKDTTTKVLEEKKIKPAGQPKIDLKTFGEGKDLEYVITVTELPNIELSSFSKIKLDEYVVKINAKETDKRLDQIAKSQKNFVDVDPAKVANEGDLVVFDYKATVEGNDFNGNEGKNTQLELGKDLFIKGFDKQLLKVKKDEDVDVEVNLPENFPEKSLVGKKAIFKCKIIAVKKEKPIEINDEFAKNLGAKDLKDLKDLISKQIKDEYKNSLDIIVKKKILEEVEKQKLDELPQNLIDQELKSLSQGMKEEEIKKNKKLLENQAIKRIKTGLILNAYGEKNNINVTEQEMNMEIQKQMKMMPGQEKIVNDYYKENPSSLESLRGTIYEEKIIEQIKKEAKITKKDITKEEAEKIIKEENEKNLKEQNKFVRSSDKVNFDNSKEKNTKKVDLQKNKTTKKLKSSVKKSKSVKKVSKK